MNNYAHPFKSMIVSIPSKQVVAGDVDDEDDEDVEEVDVRQIHNSVYSELAIHRARDGQAHILPSRDSTPKETTR